MLLPQKHIKLAESFLGLGSFIIENLNAPASVDSLWGKFEGVNNTDAFPAYHTFGNFVLAIDFLFAIGAVRSDEKGDLLLCG
jgi:hypothetical protein